LKTTILIADDHAVFRRGLSSLLSERNGWAVVGEAGDGEDAVSLAGALRPRIALLDIEMPRLTGLEAAQRISSVSPETRIVVLSMYGDARYLERAREAGASGYALKSEPIAALIDVIDLVLRGAAFASNTSRRSEAAAALRSAKVDLYALSAREREVLRMLAEGMRTQEIAGLLGLGAKSVETYRRRLMEKLGIDNVPGLVRFAIRAGVIAPDV
jgi:DNA-binding NarL/FixJ family response regulator